MLIKSDDFCKSNQSDDLYSILFIVYNSSVEVRFLWNPRESKVVKSIGLEVETSFNSSYFLKLFCFPFTTFFIPLNLLNYVIKRLLSNGLKSQL